MLKILCLGNNTVDTDSAAQTVADSLSMTNYGLITSVESTIKDHGVYHTSICDMSKTDILELAKQFDKIVLVDQPVESYDCEDSFYNTKHILTLANLRLKKDTEIINAETARRNINRI